MFTVLMSLYDKELPENLFEAIKSIWDDQKRKPDEVVLVLDGPIRDSLMQVIQEWQLKIGPKLKIISLKENSGLAIALNEGLKACSYDIVARMDTDDISLPERFEVQIDFMEKHPEIDVISSYLVEFDGDLTSENIRRVPLEHAQIYKFAKSRNPISHPCAVFRNHKVIMSGGYPLFRKSQDYALWSKMLVEGCIFANIPQVLLRMRAGTELMGRRGLRYLSYEVKIIKFQRKIGLIGFFQMISNILIRSFVRLMPAKIKSLLYKYVRS